MTHSSNLSSAVTAPGKQETKSESTSEMELGRAWRQLGVGDAHMRGKEIWREPRGPAGLQQKCGRRTLGPTWTQGVRFEAYEGDTKGSLPVPTGHRPEGQAPADWTVTI